MSARLKAIDPGAVFGASQKKLRRRADPASPSELIRMRQRERLAAPDAPARISNSTTRGAYDGAELKAHVRPGALDAFSLPSLQGGRRVYPKRNPGGAA